MKSLVIGGGGFIGSHLTERLLALGHDVTVIDGPTARFLHIVESSGAEIVHGNFLDLNGLENAVLKTDILFHLVSTTVPKTADENPLYDIETNLLGTLRLLELLKESNVKKVVFSSSGGTVYGIPRKLPIKENHSTEPLTSYGIGKLAIEKYLYLYKKLHKIDYAILRIANVYGERLPISGSQGAIGVFLSKALQNHEIDIWGDGSVVRDYLYISDVVDAFIKVISYQGQEKIFNIGSGTGHSLKDILATIEKIVDHPLQVNYMPARPFDVPINVLDISCAKANLNWQPKVGIYKGIYNTFDWMKNFFAA